MWVPASEANTDRLVRAFHASHPERPSPECPEAPRREGVTVTRVSRATSDSVIPGVRKSQRVAARSMYKDSAVP